MDLIPTAHLYTLDLTEYTQGHWLDLAAQRVLAVEGVPMASWPQVAPKIAEMFGVEARNVPGFLENRADLCVWLMEQIEGVDSVAWYPELAALQVVLTHPIQDAILPRILAIARSVWTTSGTRLVVE